MSIDKDGLAAAAIQLAALRGVSVADEVDQAMFGADAAKVITAYLAALPNTGDELVGKVERQAEVIKGQAAKLRRLRAELRRRYGDISWHRDPLNRAPNLYLRLYDARKARALKELR